jgi:hypothetical protein
MKLDLKIVCDCGLELAVFTPAATDKVIVVAELTQAADIFRKHKCKVPAATDCKCGHSANLHPELAGGKGLQSCGKAGCPCVRYQPK